MRGTQTAENGIGDRDHGVRRHRPALAQQLAQAAALDEFHDEESGSVVDALVVDRDETRMFESCDGPRLELEAAEELRVTGVAPIHHLDRDVATQPQIGAEIDRRHPAARDGRIETIAVLEDRTEQGVGRAVHDVESTRQHERAARARLRVVSPIRRACPGRQLCPGDVVVRWPPSCAQGRAGSVGSNGEPVISGA